jgi:hypothetical protein
MPDKKNREILYQRLKDLKNLEHLMVIHKEWDGMVYSYSFRRKPFNPAYIDGFMITIRSYRDNMKRGIKDLLRETVVRLSFEGYKIFIGVGRLIAVVLILKEQPSRELQMRLFHFIDLYESKYSKELKNFTGRVSTFERTNRDIEEIFDASLLAPHLAEPISVEGEKRNSCVENIYHTISLIIQRDQKYFTIDDIITLGLEIRNESSRDIISIFDDLRRKKLIYPIYMERLSHILESDELLLQELEELSRESRIEKLLLELENIPNEKVKVLKMMLEKMDSVAQQMIIENIKKLDKEDRIEYIDGVIIHWENLMTQKKVAIEQAKKYKDKGRFYDSILRYNKARIISEDLGFAEEAEQTKKLIIELLKELEEYNPTQVKELEEKFDAELQECNARGESELENERILQALHHYNSCLNISEQLNDPEKLELYREIIEGIKSQFGIS